VAEDRLIGTILLVRRCSNGARGCGSGSCEYSSAELLPSRKSESLLNARTVELGDAESKSTIEDPILRQRFCPSRIDQPNSERGHVQGLPSVIGSNMGGFIPGSQDPVEHHLSPPFDKIRLGLFTLLIS
jgi:hypothetical protein